MTEAEFLRRTRCSYDELAADYAEWITGELAVRPLERGLLGAFAELVGSGPVADIGCGQGRVARYLADRGVAAFGIDLSPEMISVARRAHPELRFEVGSMTALELGDEELAGIVGWYSIVHVPDERLPAVFAEFHRVLAPGGYLLLAFPIGDGIRHRTEVLGCEVDLDFRRRQPDTVAELLANAGLVPHAQLRREPETQAHHEEPNPQGFLLARKPILSTGGRST